MKRLLSVGLSASLGSFGPILGFCVLAYVHGRPELIDGYISVYPYQFLFGLIAYILITAQFKHETKEHETDRNKSKTGIVAFTLTGFLISAFSIWKIAVVAPFLGIYTEIQRYSFIYGLFSMVIDWSAYYYSEKDFYDKKDKHGGLLLAVWYLIKFAILLISGVFGDYRSGICFILVMQFSTLVVFFIRYGIPKNPDISILSGIRYSLASIGRNIPMGLTYLLGIHDMGVSDLAFLNAYNIVTLCTDTQWDIEASAISIVTTNEVCDGKWAAGKRKMYRNAIGYGFVLILSSVVLMCILLPLHPATDIKYAVRIFAIEMGAMPIYNIAEVTSAYNAISHPGPAILITATVQYCIRFATQMLIAGTYSISIAVVTAAIAGLMLNTAIYFWNLRREGQGAGKAQDVAKNAH